MQGQLLADAFYNITSGDSQVICERGGVYVMSNGGGKSADPKSDRGGGRITMVLRSRWFFFQFPTGATRARCHVGLAAFQKVFARWSSAPVSIRLSEWHI